MGEGEWVEESELGLIGAGIGGYRRRRMGTGVRGRDERGGRE